MKHLEAEDAVLGALFIDDKLDITDLSIDDFTQAQHKRVFSAMVKLQSDGHGIDQLTVSQHANISPISLIDMIEAVPTVANFDYWKGILKHHTTKRKLLIVGQQIVKIANEGGDAMIDSAESAIAKVTNESIVSKPELIQQSLHGALNQIANAKKNMGITGLSTGFNSVDNKLHGLRGGQLIIIAGRPGSGKTAFCLNMATRMALSGKKCLYFSLEMSKDELAMRAIVSEARADNERLRAGLIDRKTLQRLVDASARLNDAKLFIDDKADINVFEARTRARQLHREQGIDCIFIDYMQLMSGPPDMPRHLRYEIISEISRKLKALAKELDVPVVALAQLSRDIEKRSDKRPQLSDLRESGQIEQDADIVGFIHRPYLYSGDDTEKGLAELCIKKHRNGVQCDIPLIFIGEYMRFDDRDKRHD